jgi:hypothetical protein
MSKQQQLDASVKALKALQLRKLGYTYDKITEVCGYSNRGAAFHAVHRELKRTIAPVAEDVRELELARLDDLLTVYFSKAMKGDGWSMDRVLRIMERRAAFLGLDEKKDDAAHSAQIVLLSIAQDVIEAI